MELKEREKVALERIKHRKRDKVIKDPKRREEEYYKAYYDGKLPENYKREK